MSLLNEIFEQLEFERLIEEGRDPVEALHFKFNHIPEDIIDAVISIDPTRKKSYSQWLLSKWDNEKDIIIDGLKNGRIEKLFKHYFEHKDIQIKDCPSVAEGLRAFVPEEDTVLTKSSKPLTYIKNLDEEVPSELANDFDIVFNEDDWIIAVPNTYEAECKLGENMNWCTANAFGNGRGYYDNYLNKGGKYYVNFDMSHGESRHGKDYPFTRYQFHFESKQFMDKNDDPVELSEINMPESAKEFYVSEGYDEDDFVDLETKMERYEEQRWEYSVGIADGLYLQMEYDDDYEFTEPNENTSFYVFDENDDRDPISWDSVPNPHSHDDVVVLKTDNYVILRMERDDEYLLVIKETDNSRRYSYRDWNTYRIGTQYIANENLDGIFGLENVGNSYYYTYFASDGSNTYNKMPVNECENMFINEACTKLDQGKWDRIFIEAVANGYHSLFALEQDDGMGSDITCIVKRDIPKNDEYFIMNEMGVVEGIYGKHRAYGEETQGNEEDFAKYDLLKILPNGDYVVSMDVKNEDYDKHKEVLNILKKDNNKPLLDVWFDEFINLVGNLYVIEKDEKIGYFGQNGQQVGDWYDRWGLIDVEKGIAGGVIKNGKTDYDKWHLISVPEGKVFAEFTNILTSKPVNNKIIVGIYDKEIGSVKGVGYDYVERKFCYPQFESIYRLIQYNDRYFYCNTANQKVIFDFMQQKVIVNDVANIRPADRYHEYYKITKSDGKENIFGQVNDTGFVGEKEFKLLLSNDVDKIVTCDSFKKSIIFVLNGKYFVYDFRNDRILVNPNGTDICPEIDEYGYLTYADGNYHISFFPGGNNDAQLKRWYVILPSGNYGGGSDRIDANTPQEVRNLYARVTGQYSDVSEQFKNMINRINEATKLSHIDIFD